ncbi:MAG: hypothetical protein GY789_22365 [Hyphomicrobiales bacterium]|nr:hypothetical protein [Hyphomicrobiales bacterium]
MDNIKKSEWLNDQLRRFRLAHEFVSDSSVRWGELIVPEAGRDQPRSDKALRIVAITSLPIGFMTLQTLLAHERGFPDRVNLACVVTDDPMNADAKIGVRKRIWHHYNRAERAVIESQTVMSALQNKVPVYTGDIKQPWFKNQLGAMQPDAVICCGFGQMLDPEFLSIPKLGCYNIHPTDLSRNIGVGPAPYEGAKANDVRTSRWTVHIMTKDIDGGPIIGLSPPIFVRTESGGFPDNPIDYYSKMLDGLDYLVFHMAKALADKKLDGRTDPVKQLDFDALFPAHIKQRMLEPLRQSPKYPFPDPALFSV